MLLIVIGTRSCANVIQVYLIYHLIYKLLTVGITTWYINDMLIVPVTFDMLERDSMVRMTLKFIRFTPRGIEPVAKELLGRK